MRWTVIALACALGANACGGGQTRGHPLDREWDDTAGDELKRFEQQWSPGVARVLPSVAVGVLERDLLIGRQLDRSEAWTFEHPIESRPVIAGDLVIGLGGGFLFALRARDGQVLWTRRALGKLRGAGDDGRTTIVSIATLSEKRSIVLAIARDGSVRRQLDVEAEIGRPAVSDSFAFLPWGKRIVVVIDLVAGRETARIVSSHPISHAFSVDGQMYFGERVALRFDHQIVAARLGGGTVLRLPPRTWPGQPDWLGNGSHAAPLGATRKDVERIYARPRLIGDRVAIDSYAVTSFRIAVGATAPAGDLSWSHTSEGVILAGDMGADTLALCDSHGGITWLRARDGQVAARTSLGRNLMSCVIQSPTPPMTLPARGTPPTSLPAQLRRALLSDDARLLPMQLQLLPELGLIDGDEATAAVIDVATLPAGDRDELPAHRRGLLEAARELLAQRRTGVTALLKAVDRLAERLRSTCPPTAACQLSEPVHAMATMAQRTGASAALPALKQLADNAHLDDRQTRAIKDAITALSGHNAHSL